VDVKPNEGGRRLGLEIDRRKMTYDAAEKMIGVSSGFVGRLIRGERLPGRVTAERIRAEFGVEPTAWDIAVETAATSPEAA